MNIIKKVCDICQYDLSECKEPFTSSPGTPLEETVSIPLSAKFDTPRIGLLLILDHSGRCPSGPRAGPGPLEEGFSANLCSDCYKEIADKVKELAKGREDTWKFASINRP